MSDDAAALLQRIDALARDARARDLLDDTVLQPIDAALHAARTRGIDRPIERLLVVMLCGPTAVGKSSLLNALAGAAIAPVGLGATTDAPLVYLHEGEDPARLFAYGQTLGEMARGEARVVRHTSDALREKIVVDTPDIDSAVRTHRVATEAAVVNADIVLFVTSPEKYKVEEPLRWLAGHRRRHGAAFVLNKWDAAGMGLQFAQRQRVAEDFRALIATFGFADPFMFFVSTRDAAESDGGRGLAALQTWLEEQLDVSTTVAVSARARRASWGELAAALDRAVADLAGTPEDVAAAGRVWRDAAVAAKESVEAEAARIAAVQAPAAWQPQSPGPFGLMLATLPRWRKAGPNAAPGGAPFGAAAVAAMRGAADDVELLARTRHVRAASVIAQWTQELDALARDLAAVPSRAEADVVAANLRARVRRLLARAWTGAAELAITAVLALTLWRLASDFVAGRYEPFSLLGSAAAIVVLVALFGQAGLRLLFPSLASRVAAAARQRASLRLDAAASAMQGALAAQIEAAVKLRASGTALLGDIDREIAALTARAAEDETAARLFAEDAPKRAVARFE